jgi:hypothetical protein
LSFAFQPRTCGIAAPAALVDDLSELASHRDTLNQTGVVCGDQAALPAGRFFVELRLKQPRSPSDPAAFPRDVGVVGVAMQRGTDQSTSVCPSGTGPDGASWSRGWPRS